MGSRRFAGNGSGTEKAARYLKWFVAERIPNREFAGGPCRKNDPAALGMAARVLGGSFACATCALHSNQSSRIASLERESRDDDRRCFAHRRARVEAVCVSRRLDDLHDVPVARHAGFVPRLLEGNTQGYRRPSRKYR